MKVLGECWPTQSPPLVYQPANHTLCVLNRFVFEETPKVRKRLETELEGLDGDVKDLSKKLQYLETTFQKTQENISAILQRGS